VEKVTLYIPTYNRSIRLKKSLIDLISLIQQEELNSIIDILVGDNCSSDTTSEVLQNIKAFADKSGINFNHFKNSSNFGFNENIKQGYLKFQGDYIIFISDDDNLLPGALTKYLKIIIEMKPDVALINFNQAPFTIKSPLYTDNRLFERNTYDFLKPLILFPKLTGIALKNPINISLRKEISSVIIPDYYVAHVALAIYQYSKFGRGIQVSSFFAYPDKDYVDHITFLPYVNNFVRIEIDRAINMSNNIGGNELLRTINNLIPNRIIIDDSINWLFKFYTFKRNLTQEVFSELWSNCLRYFFGQTLSKSGMRLNDSQRKLKRIKILMLFLFQVKNRLWKILGFKSANIGEKSF
jgi:glycosyltransferase involved in cell wall biosynthesis